MKGGMFVSILDIQLMENCSERTAQRIHSKIKKQFDKKSSKVSIREYASFREISEEEVTEYLRYNR